MLAGHKAVYECVKAFSETDFTEDLKRFDVPTLVLHGDDDRIVPIGATSLISAKIIKGATLKVIPDAPHGMCSTLKVTTPVMTQQAKVTPILSKDLKDVPDSEVSMITVDPPGSSDPVHRHNAQAFVYILEGSVVMQVKGGKQVTLTGADLL